MQEETSFILHTHIFLNILIHMKWACVIWGRSREALPLLLLLLLLTTYIFKYLNILLQNEAGMSAANSLNGFIDCQVIEQ
jgi:hypothetical protein